MSILDGPSFGCYHGFLDSGLLLIGKLLTQGSPVAKLNSSLYVWPQQCYVCRSGAFKFARLVPCCDVRYDFHIKVMFNSGHVFFLSFLFIFTYWCPMRFNVVQDQLTLPMHLGFLVFCIMFYGSLFFLLWFFACLLCCMSFFDLRLLITPLVSSSCSHLDMWCSPFTKINTVSTWKYNM